MEQTPKESISKNRGIGSAAKWVQRKNRSPYGISPSRNAADPLNGQPCYLLVHQIPLSHPVIS